MVHILHLDLVGGGPHVRVLRDTLVTGGVGLGREFSRSGGSGLGDRVLILVLEFFAGLGFLENDFLALDDVSLYFECHAVPIEIFEDHEPETPGCPGLGVLDNVGLLNGPEVLKVFSEFRVREVLGESPDEKLPLPLIFLLTAGLVPVQGPLTVDLGAVNLVVKAENLLGVHLALKSNEAEAVGGIGGGVEHDLGLKHFSVLREVVYDLLLGGLATDASKEYLDLGGLRVVIYVCFCFLWGAGFAARCLLLLEGAGGQFLFLRRV